MFDDVISSVFDVVGVWWSFEKPFGGGTFFYPSAVLLDGVRGSVL